jgi:hypothetical protein
MVQEEYAAEPITRRMTGQPPTFRRSTSVPIVTVKDEQAKMNGSAKVMLIR